MHSVRHTDFKFNVLFQPSFYHTFLYIKVAIYLLKAVQVSFWYSQDYTTVYFKNTLNSFSLDLLKLWLKFFTTGLPWWFNGKESACNTE